MYNMESELESHILNLHNKEIMYYTEYEGKYFEESQLNEHISKIYITSGLGYFKQIKYLYLSTIKKILCRYFILALQ